VVVARVKVALGQNPKYIHD